MILKKKFILKKKIITFKSVDTYRDFVSIENLLNSLMFMIKNILIGDYNICSGQKIYLKTLVKNINSKYKKKLNFIDTNQKGLFGSNKKLLNKGFKLKKTKKKFY